MVTRVVAIDNIPFKEGGYLQGATSLHVLSYVKKYSCQLCHMARELTIHVPVLSNVVDDWDMDCAVCT